MIHARHPARCATGRHAAVSLRAALLMLVIGAATGCATLGYYGQAIGGHLEVVSRARDIGDIINDPATDPALRTRLATLLEARDFATRALHLPDNDSYRRYADLERSYIVWNVFAAPPLSLKPREWCFLVVGCVAYRGYYSRERALAAAAQLRAEGYDVYVGGVSAYSTLGWFNDPLLNTMLARGEAESTAVLFHELAHQRVYARDDSAFNESFAVTVEIEGMRRWFASRGEAETHSRYLERRGRRDALIALLLRYRARLETLYGSGLADDDKLAGKAGILDELRMDYQALKAAWHGDTLFDTWMAEDLNNAKLASVGLYHSYVPAFQRLLAAHGGDLQSFYRAVEALAKRPRAERAAALAAAPESP
jgi:predicted aminopeptidase